MAKELIVSVNGREKKIAIVEDDAVTEFYVERGDENQGIVGNIYKGRVMKVLPGMQSAFVDIGLERDSFLYVSDFLDEDEFDESAAEEKKAVPRQPSKPERTRPTRETSRTGTAVPVESDDDEKDLDLQAALSHIEEISVEPVIEPAEDDETLEAAQSNGRESGDSNGANEGRRRRQSRLRYEDRGGNEEPARARAEKAEKDEDVPTVVEAFDSEDGEESGGRRRRRPRRRRGAGAPDVDELAGDTADDSAIDTDSDLVAADTPFILVHHEPLERITDDDVEAIEGDMLKDALLQERIAGRIHQDERRASLLDVEPTPEVHVGSLRHEFGQSTDLERVSDDPQERVADETFRWKSVVKPDWRDDFVERPEVEGFSRIVVEENAEAPQDEHNDNDAGASDDEELKDASAEIRQRPGNGEFATRRGGRGRRRTVRPRVASTEKAAHTEDAQDEGQDEQEVVPAVAIEKKAAPAAEKRSAAPAPERRGPDRFTRPVISDLLREGQEIIVQIAKEPIGQKGARITSHVALPGRYIVYMPTVEHIGVSRKIGTDEERQRLKKTLHQLRAETGAPGGFIVRTAANGCTLEELREDMQYLVRTWSDIRRRSERVKAPAIAHRDLDLVQRILRDQLSGEFSAIRVDNEFEYERIVDFVNRFAPKLVHRVKLYTKDTPILEHYGVQAEIDKAVKPRVWLKSGGYIVINQTEALVAIDVNTGKFVGKSNRLEDTIVKTNLEAAKEIVRQIRLRDLGGIIVLDFIDMEERRNRQKVMQALEQELRNDRSPSKILQFNDFGLVAITRKRVKQSLERTLCTPCAYCGGGGMVKSAQTITYEILAEARRVSKDIDNHNEVILRVSPEVAKTLRGTERDVLNEIESYLGGVVTIKSDPTVHQEQFDIAVV